MSVNAPETRGSAQAMLVLTDDLGKGVGPLGMVCLQRVVWACGVGAWRVAWAGCDSCVCILKYCLQGLLALPPFSLSFQVPFLFVAAYTRIPHA